MEQESLILWHLLWVVARGPEVDLLGIGSRKLVDKDERSAVLAAARQTGGAASIIEICEKVNIW